MFTPRIVCLSVALGRLLSADAQVVSRTGHSLGIGCIHRYVGGMDASRHLQATVGILQALSRDANPMVQTWALHGLMLTIDSAGFDFHPYTEAALALVTCLIHSEAETSVHQVQAAFSCALANESGFSPVA